MILKPHEMEKYEDFNECTVYGTCSQTCVNTEGSYTCSCVEGYLLQPDNKSCKAKNEPVDRLPVLLIANSQNILATSLSGTPVPNLTPTSTKQTTAMDFNYAEETVCWIHVGDSASSTVLKCSRIPNLKAFAEERLINISLSLHQPEHELFLVYGKGRPGIIRGMDMNAKVPDEYMIPIENLMNPRALDFHAETSFIFFADATSYLIGRQKIDGTERETILKDGIHTVEGLAVDWMANNLYWTDDGPKKTISVARLEKASQTRKTLIEGKMTHPRAIVVDPLHGWMYWTDWEEDPKESKRGKIERAWMDGSNRNVFLTSKTVLWPNGLSLDIPGGVLYWVDAYYDRIEMVFLNNTERKTVYEGNELNHAFGLCHYNNFLFWNEYRSGSIYKLDQITKTVTLLRNERPPIFEIRMYDAQQQQANPSYIPPPQCQAGEFACKNNRCIQERWKCDGDNDCLDNSDEAPELCHQHTCPSDRFKCHNNRCIPIRWLCDGDNDCGNDEDESNTTCSGNGMLRSGQISSLLYPYENPLCPCGFICIDAFQKGASSLQNRCFVNVMTDISTRCLNQWLRC
ncbi:UNVERIFIED_CONTAM: hypothetical protein FKN15_014726 [Acipenser sinensis]